MRYSKKILIVEDEDQIRKLLGMYAAKNGLEADLAADGFIATSFISAKESAGKCYPVVMTDLKMPNFDGIELIADLSVRVAKKEILKPEIYVLSGYHEKGFDSVREMGISKLYQKPTDMKTLFENVKGSYDRLRSLSED